MLGHGAGGAAGAQTSDLLAVAGVAGRCGWAVALVDQPWVVAGRRVAVAPPRLDVAWLAVVEHLRHHAEAFADGVPLVLGGRSAGARVACRTASQLGADGVLCLAFPLVTPRGVSRADELPTSSPTLVAQGERDRFADPDAVRRAASPDVEVVALRTDHSLRQDHDVLTQAVGSWLDRLAQRRP
ncbi:alpha/beta hydrolase family protein [Pseudokineococcus sp. 1T1Z-3]|uniref:alpha/beta hydrolase family protein n=1 Tax=Pseudokineococcus sp. 1T1Z-3 TaxID=3132745 RepID=UPI0030AB0B1D